MEYKLKFTHQADKDARLLEQAGLDRIAIRLLSLIKNNPFQNPPEYEKLKGDMKGLYSRRINRKHRLVYDVLLNIENIKDENGEHYLGIVKIISMWTHYQ